MTMPAQYQPPPSQYFDNDGLPLAGGKITTVVTGTSTPKATYSLASLSGGSIHTNPIILDSAGRARIFLLTGAYDFIVTDSADNPVTTITGIEDLTNTFLPVIGNTFAAGARAVSTGYQILSTDNFVTIASGTGVSAAIIFLPAATRGVPLGIKNIGLSRVLVTPQGSDTIDVYAANTSYLMPAAVGVNYPTIWLFPNGTSNWQVVAAPNFVSPGSSTTVTYASGDFLGVGGGTWTVASGDLLNFKYRLLGDTLFVNVRIALSSIAGTVTSLTVKIPGGYTAQEASVWPAMVGDNVLATTELGQLTTTVGSTLITVKRNDVTAAFTASTDQTQVYFSANFKVS